MALNTPQQRAIRLDLQTFYGHVLYKFSKNYVGPIDHTVTTGFFEKDTKPVNRHKDNNL